MSFFHALPPNLLVADGFMRTTAPEEERSEVQKKKQKAGRQDLLQAKAGFKTFLVSSSACQPFVFFSKGKTFLVSARTTEVKSSKLTNASLADANHLAASISDNP